MGLRTLLVVALVVHGLAFAANAASCGRGGCSGFINQSGFISSAFENPFFNGGINDSRFFFDFNNNPNIGFVNRTQFDPFRLVTAIPNYTGFRFYTNRTQINQIPAFVGPTGFGNGHIFNTGGFPTLLDPVFGSANLANRFPNPTLGQLGFGHFGNGYGGNFGGGFGNHFGQGSQFGCGSHGLVGGCSSGRGFNGGFGGVGNFTGLPQTVAARRPELTPDTNWKNSKFDKWRENYARGLEFEPKDIGTLQEKWPQFALDNGNQVGFRAYRQRCATATDASTYDYTVFVFGDGEREWLSTRKGFVEADEAQLQEANQTWKPLGRGEQGALMATFNSGTQVSVKKSRDTKHGLNLETRMNYKNLEYYCRTMETLDPKTGEFKKF